MSLNKANPPKLLLPKVITKPPLRNSRQKLPDQLLSRTIALTMEKLREMQNGKRVQEVDMLVELSQQLANIAAEWKKEQGYLVEGYKQQQEVRYLRLKVKTL